LSLESIAFQFNVLTKQLPVLSLTRN